VTTPRGRCGYAAACAGTFCRCACRCGSDSFLDLRIEAREILALQVRFEFLVVDQDAGCLFKVFHQIAHDLLGQDRCLCEQAIERVANQCTSRVTVRTMKLEIGVDYRVRSKMALALQVQ
jgi:hypothetical protein